MDSSGIFAVLLIGSIFEYFALFYTIFLNTNKKYKILQIMNMLRAILNIFLDIVFIKIFGIYGPAIGTVLSIVIVFIILAIYSERKIKRQYSILIKNSG